MATKPKLVLLPGMDGTGLLFKGFVEALPNLEAAILPYPTQRFLSYPELEHCVREACSAPGPFVLLAESYSTPVAITYAASRPANLVGLVLCAGFATTPARRGRGVLASAIAPLVFRLPFTDLAARRWLVGPNAPTHLLTSLRSAVSQVEPKVLTARLRAVLACDVRADLRRLTVPVLYLQATHDRLVSASCLNEMRRIASPTEVAVLEGPHLLLQRHPHRTAAIVGKFVQSCARAAT